MKTQPPRVLENPRHQNDATAAANVADKKAEQRKQALLGKERRRRQVALIRRKNRLVQLEKERRRYLLPGCEDNVAGVEKEEDPPQRRRTVGSLEGAFADQCKI